MLVRKNSMSSDSELKSVEMAGLSEDMQSGTGLEDNSFGSDDMVVEKGVSEIMNE